MKTKKKKKAPVAKAKTTAAKVRFVNPRIRPSRKKLQSGETQPFSRAEALYGEPISGSIEIWDVAVDGDVRYIAYLYMGDSGTVFDVSSKAVVAQRLQASFYAKDDKPLAEEMDTAYRAARKEFASQLKASKLEGPWGAYKRALDDTD
jgi:hypothetical protein